MLPQIAPQAQQLSQTFDYTPQNAFYPELLPPPGAGRPQHQLPFRASTMQQSSRASPLAPPQYALGVRRNSLAHGSLTNGVQASQIAHARKHDPSEHMLRRKTPGGTLASAYDGSPVEWSNTGPPASKHIILPASAGQFRDNYASGSEGAILNGHPGFINPVWSRRSTGQAQYPQTDRLHLPPLFEGTDTLLNGMTLNQPPLFRYAGNQVPTVLQPAYQPCAGPTASNDPGVYGSYWPDGRFEPYRPAAVRDIGFHSYNNDHVGPFEEFLSFQNMPPNSYNIPTRHRQNSLSAPRGQSHGYSGPISSSVPFARHYTHGQEQPHVPISTSTQMPYLPDNKPYNNLPSLYGSNSLHGGSINLHFKEKALRRAHKAYTELLNFQHQSCKPSRRSSHPHSNSYTNSSAQSFSQLQGRLGPSQTQSHTGKCPAGEAHLNGYIPHSGPSRHSSHAVVNDLHGRSSSVGVTSYIPGSRATNAVGDAKDALDMLASLCQESGWSWIDGLLLGGCLAYSLEDHQKAIDWYTKIINLDSTHVEALSNLASSLLSLGRRQEAEQHWLRSVKLRPSYFEAVEHLIGLLCETHRGSEAVNIIDYVERSLRISNSIGALSQPGDEHDEDQVSIESTSVSSSTEQPVFDYDIALKSRSRSFSAINDDDLKRQPGFGSSGFAIPGSENGRMLALIHAKGNLLYALGDVAGASQAFEDAVLISAGRKLNDIQGLIERILHVLSADSGASVPWNGFSPHASGATPLLLPPDKALKTASLVFAREGELPGLKHVADGTAKKAAISTTSNSLLSLSKIFQDSLSTFIPPTRAPAQRASGVGDILALYYLSLSLQPSPSTANNVGILLAGVPLQSSRAPHSRPDPFLPHIPGVVPGSGVALALAYYNYGLNLDSRHAHLYTNLGSLLKDIGQLAAAIKMYEQAVACDGSFDIALANLANAVKDQGRVSDAIQYYKRAVASSPDFAEAVCGLANALNSVCDWTGRGGVILDGGKYDRWHVDEHGMLWDSKGQAANAGWMKRVVEIVGKQLADGASWGRGVLRDQVLLSMLKQLELTDTGARWSSEKAQSMLTELSSWAGKGWEGARVVRLVERAVKRAMHRWYRDKFIHKNHLPESVYPRPELPNTLSMPGAPTVLPFHTFTCPLSAKDIRMISQRNALRISCATLRAPWLPKSVYPPPPPPNPCLNIGYVSSDFNNHPLAHLMQSVFGMHDASKAKAFCYATTPSDQSIHRQQIEREAPVFRDTSSWSSDKLVQQIVEDEIHILVNLNGYTRGARNDVFAARPAPIQMSFMGFAGTLGAEWCDYLLADKLAVPPETLRPWRRNVDLEDQIIDEKSSDEEHWVYSENIIFCRDTFFCCDHRQSSQDEQLPWPEEQQRRWKMRKELFPNLSDDAIILGNFNQLYKIEPTTFRTWLRILARVPNAILWLLRFPDLGESNLKRTAKAWAGDEVASRIWFTDVAPKGQHISRARICDLFLDTPECNAHTTAADVLWSSTPLLTLPKYKYKMCSRMAASILVGALPKSPEGTQASKELIAKNEDQYEEFAVTLANGLSYDRNGIGSGRIIELRKLLYETRWTSALFDTQRWVTDLEEAYAEAWRRWVDGIGGDIYL